jgi:Putative abortive phage resistance protein AbiGi, antitoxin
LWTTTEPGLAPEGIRAGGELPPRPACQDQAHGHHRGATAPPHRPVHLPRPLHQAHRRPTVDPPASAAENLVSILSNLVIEARTAYGIARQLAERFPALAATQKTVCFTETPLEHAWMMNRPIDGRSIQFDGYGVAFTKTFARQRGANPVWYLDITPGHNWLTEPIRELLEQAKADATPPRAADPDPEQLADAPILRLTPFVEQMGPTRTYRKEFWWEREWRRVGDLAFNLHDIVVVFAPEGEHRAIQEQLEQLEQLETTALYRTTMPAFVDAQWGLERMPRPARRRAPRWPRRRVAPAFLPCA